MTPGSPRRILLAASAKLLRVHGFHIDYIGHVQGAAATVLAGNRGLDVKRLTRLLAEDLDWLVMRALEKDRNRRYSTPGDFAEDIARYLRHDAILARPPSTSYRLRKFAQRNHAAVLTAAAVAAAF